MSKVYFIFVYIVNQVFLPLKTNRRLDMIYLIDDDCSILRAYELFLRSAKIECITFEKATDFLSQYVSGDSDLLILDLNLPGMNGFDVLKKLNEDDNHIPVIVVTAFDDLPSRKICKELGAKAFLRKPVDGETLIDIIRYNLQS